MAVFSSRSICCHPSLQFPSLRFNSPYSQALALFHFRMTVIGATFNTSAVSSMLSPPKKRSSTTNRDLGQGIVCGNTRHRPDTYRLLDRCYNRGPFKGGPMPKFVIERE